MRRHTFETIILIALITGAVIFALLLAGVGAGFLTTGANYP